MALILYTNAILRRITWASPLFHVLLPTSRDFLMCRQPLCEDLTAETQDIAGLWHSPEPRIIDGGIVRECCNKLSTVQQVGQDQTITVQHVMSTLINYSDLSHNSLTRPHSVSVRANLYHYGHSIKNTVGPPVQATVHRRSVGACAVVVSGRNSTWRNYQTELRHDNTGRAWASRLHRSVRYPCLVVTNDRPILSLMIVIGSSSPDYVCVSPGIYVIIRLWLMTKCIA
jgi:hypothetical protein